MKLKGRPMGTEYYDILDYILDDTKYDVVEEDREAALDEITGDFSNRLIDAENLKEYNSNTRYDTIDSLKTLVEQGFAWGFHLVDETVNAVDARPTT